MTGSHFCLSSKSYKNQIFEGLSQLQQSDELVDMTLAAEGHFIKVHKTLIALASPYIRQLLQSIPCQHPVLFLNNISHEVLCFILEYIYSGEVKILPEKMTTFLDAACALHISGLSNIVLPTTNDKLSEQIQAPQIVPEHLQRPPTVKASIKINKNDSDLPNIIITNCADTDNSCPEPGTTRTTLVPTSEENKYFASFSNIHTENKNTATNNPTNAQVMNKTDILSNIEIANMEIIINTQENITNTPMEIESQVAECYEQPYLSIVKEAVSTTSNVESVPNISIQILNSNNQTDFSNNEIPAAFSINNMLTSSNLNTSDTDTISNVNQEQENEACNKPGSAIYTVTKRGSLQLILDHFMYYCLYKKQMGLRRRWRCIEYRDIHCLAFVETEDDNVVERKHQHNHPNHDEKIWKKVMKTKVFNSIQMVQEYAKSKGDQSTLKSDEVVHLSD